MGVSMAQKNLATKGRTLLSLIGELSQSDVLAVRLISYKTFLTMSDAAYDELFVVLKSQKLIVRSSSSLEDGLSFSNAGKFLSVSEVTSPILLKQAIQKVFTSYGDSLKDSEEVLIQPQLEAVKHCGVLFTIDPSQGRHYYIINDDSSGTTDAVTSGVSNQIDTYVVMKSAVVTEPLLKRLTEMAKELSGLFATQQLDIEYAIDANNKLWLLQVRPLVCYEKVPCTAEQQLDYAQVIADKINSVTNYHPYLHGKKSVLGVMPDWNPAEIIGLYPKPLALSLYKTLVTDSIWAYQRNNYGYKNLRSFPLLVDFWGLPYIDVRVSFNSFLPKDLAPALSDKLVDFYIDSLLANPSQHDSVEFDIVLSCYTPDIQDKLQGLQENGFTEQECAVLADQLRTLTNRIIDSRTGLWIQDLHRIEQLKARQKTVKEKITDPVARIYWLLEDCKRYGTLPFAGLARAAFIAVQLLKSLQVKGVFTEQQYHQYLESLNTVSGQMTRDFARLSFTDFLAEYGHLRPGTYDICSPRYDMEPEKYFKQNQPQQRQAESAFKLSDQQYQLLRALLVEHGINHSADSLLHFIQSAIEGREYAKFVFTRSLSDAIEEIAQLGERYDISREQLAYLNIDVVYQLMSTGADIKEVLLASIKQGKNKFSIGSVFKLPSLITEASEVFAYQVPLCSANFITNKKVSAQVCLCEQERSLAGKIVFIVNADPGFDWIFSHQIAGFITAFGGCNSHMAIRANELGIPAVIGAGEGDFEKWSQASKLTIDCENKKVEILQ